MRTAAPEKSKRKKAHAWKLVLYVAGKTEKSTRAFQNLHDVCEEHLAGLYEIQIIDLLRHPNLAHADQILAIPTLVRRMPAPEKRIIGDLSDVPLLMAALNLRTEGT